MSRSSEMLIIKGSGGFPDRLMSLFNNPERSDITLEARDGTVFYAHLNILSLHTEFFTKALSDKNGFTEANDRRVKFPTRGPAEIRCLLKFCYSGDYILESMDCLYSVLVYMLADFVLALELKDLAVKVMGTIFELNLTIQPWVDESSQLINAKSFAHAIYYVYKETNEGPQFAPLRKAVTDGMRQLHLAEYYGIDAELRKLIGEIGEFAVDFFSSMEEHRKGWMAGIELPFGN